MHSSKICPKSISVVFEANGLLGNATSKWQIRHVISLQLQQSIVAIFQKPQVIKFKVAPDYFLKFEKFAISE